MKSANKACSLDLHVVNRGTRSRGNTGRTARQGVAETQSRATMILLAALVASLIVPRTVASSPDDPCSSWVALDDHDRSQFHSIKSTGSRAKCDRDGFRSGWYRFTGRAGSKMPTKCVPLFRCGTEKPVWLDGDHPTVAEGTVKRKLCFHTTGDCQCEWSFPTLVRNCSEYVVYRLMPTLMCDSRYCGDGAQDTTVVDTASRPTSMSRSTHGTVEGDIAASFRCEGDEMETILNVNSAVDTKSIHLENSSCVPYHVEKARVAIKTPLTGCGTQIRVSRDKQEMVYYNHIYIPVRVPSANPAVVRDHVVVFLVECRYRRVNVVSVATYSPRKVMVHTNTEGFGNFTLQMGMFADGKYSMPFDKYPVPVNNNHRLYLQAEVKANDTELVVFLDMCKMTPTTNINDPTNHKFIQEGCSIDKTLDFNYAPAAKQRLSIQALAFRNPSKTVYVHCKVIVCQRSDTSSKCARGCPFDRRRRSVVSDHVIQQHLSLGPLQIVLSGTGDGDVTVKPDSRVVYFSSGLRTGLLVGFSIFLVIFVILLQREIRRTRRAQTNSSSLETPVLL